MAKRPYVQLGVILAGETPWQQEGRVQGTTDLPASDAGRASVRASAALLAGRAPATIHHAPDEAATETAAIIADAVGARTKAVAELEGPGLGLFEGLLIDEVKERYPKRFRQWLEDPLAVTAPEAAESIGDARTRIFAAVQRIVRKAKGGHATIVLHPIAIGLLRAWLERREPAAHAELVRTGPRIAYYTLAPSTIDALTEHEVPA